MRTLTDLCRHPYSGEDERGTIDPQNRLPAVPRLPV